MNVLSTLTPAETLFVLEERDAPIRELLKVTLMDLLLKKALKTIAVPSADSAETNGDTALYFDRGEAFFEYTPQLHEEIYLSPFRNTNVTPILYRHLLQMAFENARTKRLYQNRVIQSNELRACFSQNFLQRITGLYRRTPLGERLHNDVNSKWLYVQTNLPAWLQNDRPRAIEMMKVIGGNVFLIPGLATDFANAIDLALRDMANVAPTDSWVSYDTNSAESQFDFHYDSAADRVDSDGGGWTDSNSDSGSDGGDSGCSGCGGCGGD